MTDKPSRNSRDAEVEIQIPGEPRPRIAIAMMISEADQQRVDALRRRSYHRHLDATHFQVIRP